MTTRRTAVLLILALAGHLYPTGGALAADKPLPRHYLPDPRETHFSVLDMLTVGG